MRRFASFFVIAFLLAALLPAQEAARTEDGKIVSVCPEPVFLPDGVVAVIQMRGLLMLAPKIASLTEGLLPTEDVDGFMTRLREGLGQKSEYQGIHPFRPIFCGLYDPADIDGPLTPPMQWRDWTDVGAMGVVAVPVIDHAIFLATLERMLSAPEKIDEKTRRFMREKKTIDYDAWAADAAINNIGSDDFSRFTTIERTPVFYILADGYALLTTNEKIAGDLAKSAERPLAWRAVNAPAPKPPKTKPPRTVSLVDGGRIFDPSDDLVLSIDLGRIMRRHRNDWRAAIGRLEDDLSRWAAADTSRAPSELVGRRAFGRGIRTYVRMITAAGEDMRTVEMGFNYDGRSLACRMTAVPENPAAIRAPAFVIDRTELARSAADSVFGFESVLSNADAAEPPLVLRRVLSLWNLEIDAGEWRRVAEAFGETPHPFDLGVRLDENGGFVLDLGIGAAASMSRDEAFAFTERFLMQALRRDGKRADVRDIETGDADHRLWTLDLGEDGDGLAHAEIAAAFVKGRLTVTLAHADALRRLEARRTAEPKALPPSIAAETKRDAERTGLGFVDVFGMMAAMRRAVLPKNPDAAETESALTAMLLAHRDAGFAAMSTRTDERSWTWTCRIPREGLMTYREAFDAGRDGRRLEMTRLRGEVLAHALGRFRNDHGRYPTADEGLAILARPFGGRAATLSLFERTAMQDAWDRPFDYIVRTDGTAVVRSLGRDQKVGGESFDADLAFDAQR